MEHMRADRQRAISQETLEIYAPIANRLGLSRLKSDLEDLCFRPASRRYETFKSACVEAEERRQYIDETSQI